MDRETRLDQSIVEAVSGSWNICPASFRASWPPLFGGGLLPGAHLGWEHFFHRSLPRPGEGPLANGVAALVLIPTVWLIAKPLSRFAAHKALGTTPPPKGDRLSICVAHFADDKLSADCRDLVIASIRTAVGPGRVEVLPAEILLRLTEGVSDDIAAHEAREWARTRLKKKHGARRAIGIENPRPPPGARPYIQQGSAYLLTWILSPALPPRPPAPPPVETSFTQSVPSPR